MRIVIVCVLLMWSFSWACGQTKRNVNTLKQQQKEVKKGLAKSEKALESNKKAVRNKEKTINILEGQLQNRLRYIKELETDITRVNGETQTVKKEITRLDNELARKRSKYIRSLRYARTCREVQSPLLFVFSAESFSQMYRRARYAKEYAAYQRVLGEQVMRKQGITLKKRGELLEKKSEMNKLMHEVMAQRTALHAEHAQQKKAVEGLKRKQKDLVQQVNKQRKQLAALDKKIDELVAYEIEQARKRAEAEAAKKAAAESAKKQSATPATAPKEKVVAKAEQAPVKKSSDKWITPEDYRLNGTFEKNKGRLPVPITGVYMLGNRFGTYNVPGLKGVKLDNKGTNYVGRAGARARAIFEGEVSAVFQMGDTKNVLIRHGSYISVYCNLSSVIVKRGQKVRARDLIGAVAKDEGGNCVLHFQLRKETTKLNPELWLAR